LRRRKLEREIIRLAKCRDDSKEWLLRWIVVGLEYFHGRKIGKKAIRLDMVRKEAEGLVVALEGTKSNYWIPTGKWNPKSYGLIGGEAMTDEPTVSVDQIAVHLGMTGDSKLA
jgi:hypothetical protein